jgi:hypothetical protein
MSKVVNQSEPFFGCLNRATLAAFVYGNNVAPNVDGDEVCWRDRVGPVGVKIRSPCPPIDPGEPGVSLTQNAYELVRLRAASRMYELCLFRSQLIPPGF